MVVAVQVPEDWIDHMICLKLRSLWIHTIDLSNDLQGACTHWTHIRGICIRTGMAAMAKISCQLTTTMHATFPRQTRSDRSTQRPVHSKDLCFVDWIPWVTPEAETSNGAMSALACKDETWSFGWFFREGYFFFARFCFFWFLLLCFSCCSGFLLFLLTLLFLLLCFSAFPAFVLFLLFCFLLLCFSAFCFSCFFVFFPASLLPVFTVSWFFIFFCFILSCFYPKWNPRETLNETLKMNPKDTINETPKRP